nr:MAG TPA: hypothetical protein [Caudoviricetes sp.]
MFNQLTSLRKRLILPYGVVIAREALWWSSTWKRVDEHPAKSVNVSSR